MAAGISAYRPFADIERTSSNFPWATRSSGASWGWLCGLLPTSPILNSTCRRRPIAKTNQLGHKMHSPSARA
jgi:hypothetical protein